MFTSLKSYFLDEEGAVTVDWVVLTAFIVGMSVAVMAIFHDGPINIGAKIGTYVGNLEPN
jgi:hypothetical protein